MPSFRRNYVVVLAVGLGLAVGVGCEKPAAHRMKAGRASPPDNSPPSLIASTSELKHTIVVPTLDTPIPEGKSAIWCASIQLAWNIFRQEITHGPIQLRNAEAVAKRLNDAPQSESDIDPQECYAIAGTSSEVTEKIRSELPARFPGIAPPQLKPAPPGMLRAFAFLKAGIRYTSEFTDNPRPFEFVDSEGTPTNVHSFGLPPDRDKNALPSWEARKQVILRWHSDWEFAVDLCRDSEPDQVVLACLNRKWTLAELLADEEVNLQRSPTRADYRLDEDDLLVPNMFWRIDHHFQELEGPDKTLLNGPSPDLYLATAWQEIQFKLDRRGAEIMSGVDFAFADGGPKTLYFNRPFLVYLKKRGAQHPFFVMWVDNAELMQVFVNGPPKRG